MLLREYTFTVAFPECVTWAMRVNAVAELSDDISEVLPYINARVKAGIYSHKAGTLRFVHEGHGVNLFPRRITVSGLLDRDEAKQVLDWVKEFINTTWDKRHQIEPSYRKGDEVKAIDVYKLLPGTNCRECGEPSCMAFAARLARQQKEPDDCPVLLSDEWEARRQALIALVESGVVPPHDSKEKGQHEQGV